MGLDRKTCLRETAKTLNVSSTSIDLKALLYVGQFDALTTSLLRNGSVTYENSTRANAGWESPRKANQCSCQQRQQKEEQQQREEEEEEQQQKQQQHLLTATCGSCCCHRTQQRLASGDKVIFRDFPFNSTS